MLALKYLLMILGTGFFGSVAALVAYDIYMAANLRSLLAKTSNEMKKTAAIARVRRTATPLRWKFALPLAAGKANGQ